MIENLLSLFYLDTAKVLMFRVVLSDTLNYSIAFCREWGLPLVGSCCDVDYYGEATSLCKLLHYLEHRSVHDK